MSTAELYLDEEEIRDFIAETRADHLLYLYGEEGQEYGVCPFITFYIYRGSKEDFLPLCHEVIELHQELQTLIDRPYLMAYNTKGDRWVKATPEKLGRELLREHARLAAEDGYDPFYMEATTEENPGISARWAISARVSEVYAMRYSIVKINFRDEWYRQNREVWRDFVNKWLHRLQPEQCYSGYEIGSATVGAMGAYESDVMERICADHFYGLDIDHAIKMGFHDNNREVLYECVDKEYRSAAHKKRFMALVSTDRIGAGIRTPTWCFLLSPLWRNKLGKSVEEVREILSHPDIHITEFPYPVGKHNPKGEPALWIRLGELNLYPVDQGVPALPVIASALIKPIRCNLLQLHSLDPWDGDPNPRFDFENSPRWMARFDPDSKWPDAKRRFIPPTLPMRIEGGEVCTREGWWWSPADNEEKVRFFKYGEITPIITSKSWGQSYWLWHGEMRKQDKK
jgi:hypothetical protein